MAQPQVTFPFAPVIDRVCERTEKRRPDPDTLRRLDDELVVEDIASSIGFSRRTVHRYLRSGVIPERRADEIATALGRHPIDIWPDYHERTVDADA